MLGLCKHKNSSNYTIERARSNQCTPNHGSPGLISEKQNKKSKKRTNERKRDTTYIASGKIFNILEDVLWTDQPHLMTV